MNRYNQTEDYYADTAIGSMTIENKTDFKFKFGSAVSQQIDTGSPIAMRMSWTSRTS